MPAGPRHVVGVAVAIFFLALALPAEALAGHGSKCNASACKVYIEPNAPSPGGSQGPQGPQGPQQNPTESSSSSPSSAPSNVARVLAHAGPDKAPLARLMEEPGLGNLKSGASGVAAPSGFAAAFDLGSGPAVLLGILLATALGVLLHSGLRARRRRRTTA